MLARGASDPTTLAAMRAALAVAGQNVPGARARPARLASPTSCKSSHQTGSVLQGHGTARAIGPALEEHVP